MPFRSLTAALALVFAAAAAPTASAQHVVYPAPVVYHQPLVHSTPVVYHQPVYTSGSPWVQSGQWVNRPNLLTPESNRPFRRSAWNGEYADGLGFPFNNRTGLNIAYRLAWR